MRRSLVAAFATSAAAGGVLFVSGVAAVRLLAKALNDLGETVSQ